MAKPHEAGDALEMSKPDAEKNAQLSNQESTSTSKIECFGKLPQPVSGSLYDIGSDDDLDLEIIDFTAMGFYKFRDKVSCLQRLTV